MRQFFLRACASTSIAGAWCQLFDTCCDPPVPFSLYLSLQDGLFGDEIYNSQISLLLLKEFAQQQVESSAGFVFSVNFNATTFFLRGRWGGGGGAHHCFGVFRTIADMVFNNFKADILPTCDFFEWQGSCTSLTLSVSSAATAPIGYQIRVLETIGAAEHKEPGLWD